MSEIDWSKAPEGATHYCKMAAGFRGHGDSLCSYCIPRPTQKAQEVEWDGKAWPIPVGVAFENGFGEDRTVVAHDQGLIVCRCGGEAYRAYDESYLPKFRPIRTKEQRLRGELAEICQSHITADEYGHNLADAILSRYNLEPKP